MDKCSPFPTFYFIPFPFQEFPYLFTNQNSQSVPQNPWTQGKICWQPGTSRKVVRPSRGVRDLGDLQEHPAPRRVPLDNHNDPAGLASVAWVVLGVMVSALVLIGVIVPLRRRMSKTRKTEVRSSGQTLQFENQAWDDKE